MVTHMQMDQQIHLKRTRMRIARNGKVCTPTPPIPRQSLLSKTMEPAAQMMLEWTSIEHKARHKQLRMRRSRRILHRVTRGLRPLPNDDKMTIIIIKYDDAGAISLWGFFQDSTYVHTLCTIGMVRDAMISSEK